MGGSDEDLKEAHPKDVNAVNAATALYKIAKISHKSRPLRTQLDFVATLVESKIGEFNAQGVANTIYAYATLGLTPSDRVQEALSDAVLRLAGEFTAQGVANTIWAYAILRFEPQAHLLRCASALSIRFQAKRLFKSAVHTWWVRPWDGLSNILSPSSSWKEPWLHIADA